MKKTMKRVLPVLALVLVVAVASVGGTIAWLTDKTGEVKNTFTVGNIDIDLYETKKPDGTDIENQDGSLGRVEDWNAKLIPGNKYAKNPIVTVKANSEDCYLFVKFEENNNPSNYLTYTSTLTVANGWTQGNGTTIPANVWYRTVFTSNIDQSWYLLKGEELNADSTNAAYVNGFVTVKDDLLKAGSTGENVIVMPAADKVPELKYTAYAIQHANMTDAVDAWNKVKD